MTVACPTCRAEVEWSDAIPWRPFCSARCKGIDLGEWASNRFVIAGANLVDGEVGNASAEGDLRQ
jgi:uncharacterized protein